jgi:hypothetical protein
LEGKKWERDRRRKRWYEKNRKGIGEGRRGGKK